MDSVRIGVSFGEGILLISRSVFRDMSANVRLGEQELSDWRSSIPLAFSETLINDLVPQLFSEVSKDSSAMQPISTVSGCISAMQLLSRLSIIGLFSVTGNSGGFIRDLRASLM